MHHIPLDELEDKHLQQLIEEGRREDKRIDYKSQRWKTMKGDGNPNDSPEKRAAFIGGEIIEFLKDVSAFANTNGGDIVVGMAEQPKGMPSDLAGDTFDPDKLMSHLKDHLQNSLEPRLTVPMKPVPLANGNHALVIRVPESVLAPHRVTRDDHGHFYHRVNADSLRMNTDQIRQAMLIRGTVRDQMKNFHTNQIATANQAYQDNKLLEAGKPTFVMHLIPYESLAGRADIQFQSSNPRELHNDFRLFREIMDSPGQNRLNLEGLLRILKDPHMHIQLFRNGIIEVVDRSLVKEDQDGRRLRGHLLAAGLSHQLPRYLNVLNTVGINPPIWIAISLLMMNGYRLEPNALGTNYPTFDRVWYRLPEFEITDYSQDVGLVVKGICDLVWQTVNAPSCDFLDAQGKYIGPM